MPFAAFHGSAVSHGFPGRGVLCYAEGMTVTSIRASFALSAACLAAVFSSGANGAEAARVRFRPGSGSGRLECLVEGRVAFVYRYGDEVDLPHFLLYSPSGKLMTVEHPQPYPHHRSVWFADTVQLAGKRRASFYSAFYTRVDKADPHSPFRDRIRHLAFGPVEPEGTGVVTQWKLRWEMDLGATPVLAETRTVGVVPLGQGEYLLDLTFTVTAAYGDVAFVSDAVHYAWPYVRMTPGFSVNAGGTITNSEGGVNQAGTNMKVATWVDYSNTVNGVSEGLAVFSHSSNPHPHRWLTRDYGTFGPRRVDARSGKRFVLHKGESLTRRVGILVHRGNVTGGRVAERYREYSRR